MHFTMKLEDETCTSCDGELIWWSEDETETTMEVYVDCADCGRNYPKAFVDKSDDTSDDALEAIARRQVR